MEIVYNPNFHSDIEEILGISISEEAIRQLNAGSYSKLSAFINRIEFIRHLQDVKTEAIDSQFKLGNNEVNGIDKDIDALRLYLDLRGIYKYFWNI